MQTTDIPPRDFERELVAAQSDAARLSVLLDAGAQAEVGEDFSRAHDFYRRAAELAGQHSEYREQRVQAVLGVARSGEEGESGQAMLEALLPSLTGEDSDTRLLRATVLAELVLDFTTRDAALALTRAEEVVNIRAALSAAADSQLLDARRAYAWRLWQAARGEEALAQLRARAQALEATACDAECVVQQGWLRRQTYGDLGWLLLALQQPAPAAQLAADYPALRTAAKSDYMIDDTLPVLDAWISQAGGDYAKASASLKALLDSDAALRPVFAELQWLVDLAMFAEQAGDPVAARQWVERLNERATALRAKYPHLSLGWMRTTREAPYTWQGPRLDRQLAWLEAHMPALLRLPP